MALTDTEIARAADERQLLMRYVEEGHEAAFAAVMRGHWAMVHATCRRIDEASAEDAAQAVFIVLAKQAKKAAGVTSLGAWLHQVAVYTALRARRERLRRVKHERLAAAKRKEAQGRAAGDVDAGVIHQAIAALPEKYRVAVVEHYLEGRSLEEIGERSGAAANTVAKRLERARVMLQGKLALAAGVAVMLSALKAQAAATTAPETGVILAGAGSGSSQIGQLASDVLTHFWRMKMLKVAGTVLVAALVGAGVSVGVQYGLAQTKPADNVKVVVAESAANKVLLLKAMLQRPEVLLEVGFSAEGAQPAAQNQLAAQEGKLLGRPVRVGFVGGKPGYFHLLDVTQEESEEIVKEMTALFGKPTYANEGATGWRGIVHDKAQFEVELMAPQQNGKMVLAVFAVREQK